MGLRESEPEEEELGLSPWCQARERHLAGRAGSCMVLFGLGWEFL